MSWEVVQWADQVEEQQKKDGIDAIQREINELEDTDTGNDKVELNWILTSNFAENLKQEDAKNMLDAISGYLDTLGDKEKPEWLDSLIKFLEPIANKFDFDFTGMTQVEDGGFEDIDSNKFFNRNVICNKELKENESLSKIEQTLKNTRDLLESYSNILNKNKNIKVLLEGIQNTLLNPTTENVQMLQKIIHQNLSETEREQFEKDNSYKNGKFDWKFGKTTLEHTDKIISQLSEQLRKLQDAQNVMEEHDKEESLNKVEPKSNISLEKWWTIDDAIKSWLEGLPNGATVSISQRDRDALGNPWEHGIILTVKLWDKTRDISVNVTVVDNTDNGSPEGENSSPESGSTDNNTEPLNFDNNQFLVMNDPRLNSIWLAWATFYAISAFNDETPWEWQPWKTMEAPSGEYECYLKLSNKPDDLYKIKVDEYWNLCPIATKIDLRLKNMSTEVLFSNNGSCIKYLENKIPEWLDPRPTIERSENSKDYVLKSYWNSLTIEPMTVAWKWVSKDLWRSLALLNLTNYIKDIWKDYWDKEPDIDFDSFNNLWIMWLKKPWKLFKVNKKVEWFPGSFGLNGITDWERMRFQRYNNKERWNDDWDAKWDNKIYTKIG